MWNQWAGMAGAPLPPPMVAAPPLPTTAPPPPPSEPAPQTPIVPNAPTTATLIGPVLPSVATPTAPVLTADLSTAANPYSEYTAAQYAAMTPEQQYALQQHWQQWQAYQQEYAKWHAQYGEQYKREMEAAAANNPAYAAYYQQQQPPVPTTITATAPKPVQQPAKITGQPQLYVQQPPALNQMNSSSLPPATNVQSSWPQQQQTQPQYNHPPPNYNISQPPPSEPRVDGESQLHSINRDGSANYHSHQNRSYSDERDDNDNHMAVNDYNCNQNRDNNRGPQEHGGGLNLNLSAGTDNRNNRGPNRNMNNRGGNWNNTTTNRGNDGGNNLSNESNNNWQLSGWNNNNNRPNIWESNDSHDDSTSVDRGPSWGGSSGNKGPNNRNNDGFNNRDSNWNNNGPNSARNSWNNNNNDDNWNNDASNNRSGLNVRNNDAFDNRSRNLNCWDNNGSNNNWNQRGGGGNNSWNNGPNGSRSFANRNSDNNQRRLGGGGRKPPELDEESFDRQFRQWEEQFEEWKRANANHPDREMYRRYEQEFEKQRQRIIDRREQMRRRKMVQMGLKIQQSPQGSQQPNNLPHTQNPPQNINSLEAESTSQNRCLNQHSDEEKAISSVAIATEAVTQFPESVNKEDACLESTDRKSQSFRQEDTPLGKRKTRFSSPPSKMKALDIATSANITSNSMTMEIIDLEDDDEQDDNPENSSQNMSEIFKKPDGIPGLDLVEGGNEKSGKNEEIIDANQIVTEGSTKKIPSLFDVKVDKPTMDEGKSDENKSKAVASGAIIPDIANSLNDPEFMKKISEAVAKAQGKDCLDNSWQNNDNVRSDNDGRPLTFAEWQRRKGNVPQKRTEQSVERDNQNSSDSFRQKRPNQSEPDDNNSNYSDAYSGSAGVDGDERGPNVSGNLGADPNSFAMNRGGNNHGPNHFNNRGKNFGPNGSNGPNNFGPNGPNNFGSTGPNSFGSNSFGPNGPNNFGPNGNNNFGPNGLGNFGSNGLNNFASSSRNNFGPNSRNNFGPNGPNNFGPNGPNNFGPSGPNNFGPNGPNNFGTNGPNNFGPNGSNNFGPNGPNNFGTNGPNNFRGYNNRNFGGPNGSNFGSNGPTNFSPNFGPNGPNFGHNGSNFNSNSPNFGPSGPNFGPNGGNFASNFGPNGPNFASGGRKFGRNGPSSRRNFGFNRPEIDDSHSQNGSNFGGDGGNSDYDDRTSDQNTSSRNKNNPFRRNDGPNVPVFDNDDNKRKKRSHDGSDSWVKGPNGGGGGGGGGDDHNSDYGGYYRPVQVIDYSNNTMTPKVIDYGHKPADEYKPIKTIDYGHASKPSKPQQQQLTNNKQQQQQSTAQQRLSYMQRKRLRKKLKQQQKLQTDIDKTQDNENKNEEEKSKQQNINNDDDYEKEEQSEQQEGEILENDSENDKEKSNDDLEEISDAEDLNENIDTYVDEGPPAPPPPPMLSSGSKFMPIYKVSSETPTSIFPSTAIANENIPKMSAKHVQMSFPSVENQNTISVDEILFKPGRLTRPKKICVILRGPPGSGKSHVAKLIKEKEKEMGSGNPRILSVDDYFLIENDYEEKCPKTGKKIPKKEILYEYDNDMEETYMQYLIKSFKKTITDNLYDFIVIDCNNNSLRTLNEFYCHSKDSGFMPYIIDLFCDLETCLSRNIHQRSMDDIKNIIDTWKPTPLHYIKLDVSTLLENVVEMEDAENVAVDENKAVENTENDSGNQLLSEGRNEDKDVEDDSNDGSVNCGFLKSKWETDNTSENLARLDGTRKLGTKRKPTMEEYLQMDDWQPRIATNGKKRVRWADIEEKREQDKMRAVGFVVGHTDWKRMMDPNAANRALNKTKYIERVKKRR